MYAIRRADAGDLENVARLHQLTRRTNLPFLPILHTPDGVLRFFRDRVFRECEVWVAGHVDGFIAFRAGWVDHLYVAPDRQRRGIGSALLAQAMRTHSPLRLWTFQKNLGAIEFYAAHGFHEIERTDGSGNEEREPDILLEWGEPANSP